MKITVEMIIALLLTLKGQFARVKFQSIIAPSANFKGIEIKKVTSAIVRCGINFANLTSVKQGIENNERSEVQNLPWGTWKKFPYVIEHKGQNYLRLYPSVNTNHIPKVTYFVDGIETKKVKVMELVTPSKAKEMKLHSTPECFTIKESNLLAMDNI